MFFEALALVDFQDVFIERLKMMYRMQISIPLKRALIKMWVVLVQVSLKILRKMQWVSKKCINWDT